ncbi:MAG: fatty acid desaturase [Alphaproteobacteria bacterium]|nr:fatty acid desaturase [Alphaproteobacteria bacterium]
MLRHPADRRTLVVLALHVASLLTFVAVSPGGVGWLAWVATLTAQVVVTACIAHDVAHVPLWRRAPRAEEATRLLLSALQGVPFGLYHHHVTGHHVDPQGPLDTLRTTRVPFRHPLVALVLYMPSVLLGMKREQRRPVPDPRALRRQRGLVWGGLAVLLAWDPSVAVGVFVAHQIGNLLFTSVNHLQHHGCDVSRPFAHSRSFTGRWLNRLTFNAGYHAAHHERPGVHWSELPAFHAAIEPEIPTHLVQTSLVGFLVRSYVLGR